MNEFGRHPLAMDGKDPSNLRGGPFTRGGSHCPHHGCRRGPDGVLRVWRWNAGRKAGWRSRGYREPYLAAQETRVRRFHEVLNDYLNGHPPGRPD